MNGRDRPRAGNSKSVWQRFVGFVRTFGATPAPINVQVEHPLDQALLTGRHLLVQGPDLESELARIEEIVAGWQRRRDAWHSRMADAGADISAFVPTLNDQPLKKGVYVFHDGPFARTPGVRRIRDSDLGSDLRSGILAVGPLAASHFAIAAQARWTLIGCAGGGGNELDEILVNEFDDVVRARQQTSDEAT